MDKQLKAQFNEAILAEGAKRFGLPEAGLRLLDGFENFIYEAENGGRSFILRFSHSGRRTADMIRGEVEWINYLADGGLSVARAVPSPGGCLVETVDAADGYFSAALFEKAPGHVPNREDRTPELFTQMGRMIGRMHALTRSYTPSDPAIRRLHWDEDTDCFPVRYLPASEEKVIARANELMDYLKALPREKDSYGLVHIDFHYLNFFVDGGRITLFDFDDCQYNWFAADIAMPLFYLVPHHCDSPKDRAAAQEFMDRFMEGYSREYSLDRRWLQQIPYFLKQREIDLYMVIHRSFDLNHLDKWCASYMDDRKRRIEEEVPYVDIAF